MKWFKHESNSIHESSIEKLIQKYGVEGYGLYYACIELISQRLSGDNVDFELHHDAETLANKFKIDTLRVEEIMKFCVKTGLFQYNTETQNIVCMRLVKMLDISTSNNPEIKNILNDPNYKKLLDTNSRLDYITLDNNTEDNIKYNITQPEIKKVKTKKIADKSALTDDEKNLKTLLDDYFTLKFKNRFNTDISKNKVYYINLHLIVKEKGKQHNYVWREFERRINNLDSKVSSNPEYNKMSLPFLYKNWDNLLNPAVQS